MNNQQCPVCKRDSYLNPNINILVSPCFHKLCEQCVYEIFASGYAPCPECKTPLRRLNFTSSTFEDVNVECEIRVRKQLQKYFIREEHEFSEASQYNDYLEEFEDLVFSLLKYKNEGEITDRINKIRNGGSILNPRIVEKKVTNAAPEEDAVKRMKPSTATRWGIFEEPTVSMPVLRSIYQIPSEILPTNECNGITSVFLNHLVCASWLCD